MIRKVPLVLAIMLLASASKEDETRKDLEKIQGDWAEVSYVVDGVKVPDDEAQALSFACNTCLGRATPHTKRRYARREGERASDVARARRSSARRSRRS